MSFLCILVFIFLSMVFLTEVFSLTGFNEVRGVPLCPIGCGFSSYIFFYFNDIVFFFFLN